MAYLQKRGIEKLELNCEIEYTSIQYINYYPKLDNLPSFIEKTIDEIIESYADELYDLGPRSADMEASDYFTVDIEITPENKIMTFVNLDFTEYVTESDGRYYDFNDYTEEDSMYDEFIKIQKFLKEHNINEMRVDYNGGGDSGYIGEIYESKNGSGRISDEIEEICYYLLEEFGGWEINEGSSGIIRMSNDEIEVEHEWNVEMNQSRDLDIVVTLENIE